MKGYWFYIKGQGPRIYQAPSIGEALYKFKRDYPEIRLEFIERIEALDKENNIIVIT